MPFQPRCSNSGPCASESLLKLKTSTACRLAGLATIAVLWSAVASGAALAQANIESQKHNDSAQDGSSAQIPFEVSNPKHMKWPELEAGRIDEPGQVGVGSSKKVRAEVEPVVSAWLGPHPATDPVRRLEHDDVAIA